MPPVLPSVAGYPQPGRVVWVPAYLFYHHRGIVSDRWHAGKPMVISNSARKGEVCEESWDDFAGGQQVFDGGYPSSLFPEEVVLRARMLVGQRYDLLGLNCDHVVAAAHGGQVESPQLNFTLAVLGVAIGAMVVARA